jgi:hypothetical protein
MIAVITGDIVHSRKVDSKKWIKELKECMQLFGKEQKTWDIYRGDSFQLELPVKDAIIATILIRLCIRKITHLDARMAIGIGAKKYKNKSIKQSNGSAFEHSGHAFEYIVSKNQLLKINSDAEDIDLEMNIYLDLITHIISTWKPAACFILYHVILNRALTQSELAEKISRKQSQISLVSNKAGIHEILKALDHLSTKLETI